MNINFKQPKYVLPIIILPFLCLFFYVYYSGGAKEKSKGRSSVGINSSVGDVSPEVKKKQLADKLDAFRSKYKNADGYTAVNPIPEERPGTVLSANNYSDQEKRKLDSIKASLKQQYAAPQVSTAHQYKPTSKVAGQNEALVNALNNLQHQRQSVPNRGSTTQQVPKEKDPMELFKQQMSYMDSINKLNDPAYKAEKQRKDALAKAAALRADEKTLGVSKAVQAGADFNTVMPERNDAFIMAIIDENVTGFAGSRIRLRLLEDITAGNTLIKSGTYLYALINGFSGQRVTLVIKSILYNHQMLPVKLDVYDLDGLPGLYVPDSQFRDFTKDLGTSSIQGINIDGNSQSGSQFLMSTAAKMFQSTSSAIAGAIRKNKAKIKYNSYLYLIDTKAQEKAQ